MDERTKMEAAEPKHQGILSSVDLLTDTVGRVEGLLTRIVDGEGPPIAKAETGSVTLAYALDNSAGLVRGQIDRLHDIVTKMEGALF